MDLSMMMMADYVLDALVTGKAERSVHFSDYILFYQEVRTKMTGILVNVFTKTQNLYFSNTKLVTCLNLPIAS